MSQRAFLLAVTALALLSGCSDFWGAGLDPSRAGPYEGPLAGTSSGGSSMGVSGSGSGCEFPPCPGSGGSGNGDIGTVLASNLGNNVNAIALDDEFVYFTTNQGLARVPKSGGEPEPLGGFNGISGLAVAVGYVYLVEGSGAVTRVPAAGGKAETIVTSMFGGGGSIVVDATNMFYLVGPYVRRAPLEGGTASDLTSDVFQGGVSAHRLALDGVFAYYVASPIAGGSTSQLRKIAKDAPGGMSQPNGNAGTLVAEADGLITFVTSDGESVYFADAGSDGLRPRVEIRKVTSGVDPPSELVATWTPSGNNNNPGNGGGAMVSDGDHIYFGGPGGLFKVAVEGGEIETIDEQAMTNAIAIDDRYLFWADQNSNGTLRRLAK